MSNNQLVRVARALERLFSSNGTRHVQRNPRRMLPTPRRHKPGCNGTHCQYPGHEHFCLTKYVNHIHYDHTGPVYCWKHFRLALNSINPAGGKHEEAAATAHQSCLHPDGVLRGPSSLAQKMELAGHRRTADGISLIPESAGTLNVDCYRDCVLFGKKTLWINTEVSMGLFLLPFLIIGALIDAEEAKQREAKEKYQQYLAEQQAIRDAFGYCESGWHEEGKAPCLDAYYFRGYARLEGKEYIHQKLCQKCACIKGLAVKHRLCVVNIDRVNFDEMVFND
jgi:hypothetical protein